MSLFLDFYKFAPPVRFKTIFRMTSDYFSECPNYGAIIPTLLEHEIEELPKRCKLTPGMFHYSFLDLKRLQNLLYCLLIFFL